MQAGRRVRCLTVAGLVSVEVAGEGEGEGEV